MTLNEIGKLAYEINESHGFNENWDDSQKLLLAVSEICEAVEELRDGHAPDEIYYTDPEGTLGKPKPEGFPVELADAVIRIAASAHKHGINLGEICRLKLEYNKTRPFKHGRKF